VKTITTHEAKTHLSRYLAAIERGEEFIIARGKKPVAILSPLPKEIPSRRPRVGETLGPRISIPDSAFAPLTDEELKEWSGE
jgi:antitoxin (DNA-binding transcriptional repressor) of toxin-antitoxin stability system